ncbi:MAG: carbohydrate ABC transporter permease [Candidatus Omnitrophica bacterium]|nr:carbohydrate ABC transporter permease [Candidatus Omnitrophota bacterium]
MENPIYYRVKKIFSSMFLQMFLVGVAATCIFPLLWMFGSSLKTQSTVFSDMSLFPKNPHWENYYIAWTKGEFGVYFFNSVFYTAVTVVCIVIFTSMAAYGISRLRMPGKNIIFYAFLAAMMIPIPGAFVALYAILINLGFINPGTGVDLLDNVIKRLGYILPQINQGLSLGIFMLKTFFDKIPKDLEDSARIDGCGKFGVYWHIALPLAKPAIAVIVIINVLYVWNEYLLAMLILTDKSLMPLQRGLMVFQGAHMTQYPLLMSGITITVIPIILVYLFMQRQIITGITAGMAKG